MVNYDHILSPSIFLYLSSHCPDGLDYVFELGPFQFPPTDQAVLNYTYNLAVPDRLRQSLPISLPLCANISIIDNDIIENGIPKVLRLNISHDSSMVTFIPPTTATVTIVDDDSKLNKSYLLAIHTSWILSDFTSSFLHISIPIPGAMVHLEALNLTVFEGESILICVKMLGIADFIIHALLRPVGISGSAQGGVDFIAAEQLVEFPAFSSEHQCVLVQTIDDSTAESDEQFYVELALVEENSKISLGTNQSVSITIVDNDCKQVVME